ncbi:hypothetical protein QR680_002070 [Steinernema hermaphroditum]|uniref:Uncharacterized protein n=1 Tax=Steinernema hermaphroditum TaxID=289476 RepID=A0AA39H143_9BILA|nr:hypothetical protein QR680_002070 [Steinernema hermaphroditum]
MPGNNYYDNSIYKYNGGLNHDDCINHYNVPHNHIYDQYFADNNINNHHTYNYRFYHNHYYLNDNDYPNYDNTNNNYYIYVKRNNTVHSNGNHNYHDGKYHEQRCVNIDLHLHCIDFDFQHRSFDFDLHRCCIDFDFQHTYVNIDLQQYCTDFNFCFHIHVQQPSKYYSHHHSCNININNHNCRNKNHRIHYNYCVITHNDNYDKH